MKTLCRVVPAVLLATIAFNTFATRQRESLEAFDRKDLVVWHISLKGKCGPSAGILDTGGFSHRIQVGNYLGKDFGLVKEITKDGVRIVEIYRVGEDWKEREVWLRAKYPYDESTEIDPKK